MVFVICIGIICRYFVGHGSCMCKLCETCSLKIYEKYVWIFCEECVRTYVIHLLRTYVTILCNWLIL